MPRALGLTRVAIVEDHLLFAESLEVALSLEGHDVVRIPLDEGMSSSALLSALLRAQARIVLLDLDLGEAGSGVRLIQPLVRSGAAVVVVTGDGDRARWGECLVYGARTVLDKASSLNTILATIRRVGEGRALMTREERDALVHHFQTEKRSDHETRLRLENLTPREQEVLGHLMLGHAVRDIARTFVVSEATVRTQVKSILSKLEVSSQLAAVGAANAVRWRPPQQQSLA